MAGRKTLNRELATRRSHRKENARDASSAPTSAIAAVWIRIEDATKRARRTESRYFRERDCGASSLRTAHNASALVKKSGIPRPIYFVTTKNTVINELT